MSAAGRRDPAGAPRVRPAAARGRTGRGGISALEAFSRGDVFDPAWMGWGSLRVLSHQQWEPGALRDEGRVANMERLLLVQRGRLDADCGDLGRHRVAAGGALWMGAGHGLSARLCNASPMHPLRLVELWLQPARVNAAPRVALPPPAAAAGADAGRGDAVAPWILLAPPGQGGAAHPPSQSRPAASLYIAQAPAGRDVALPEASGGRFWLEVLEGGVALDGPCADPGADGARAGEGGIRLRDADGVGWCAGDPGAPRRFVVGSGGPASVLFIALPG